MSTKSEYHTHSTDALDVMRHVLSATSDYECIPPKIRVTFRHPDGAVGKRDVATHWLHSYPAKMFHRIPRQILVALDNRKRTVVLDPFCGSGTVLIEAALRGTQAIGIDVNPLALLLAEVKSTPPPPAQLRCSASRLLGRARKYSSASAHDPLLDFWFKRSAQESISHLRKAIDDVRNPKYRNFFLIALSSIVRRCSLADPSIAPPVRLSDSRAHRANARYRRDLARAHALTGESVYVHFETALENNIRRIGELNRCHNLGQVRVLGPPAEAAYTTLRQRSVDVILTSPPYCGAQKYVRSLRLELYWLGYTKEQIAAVDCQTLGTERVSKRANLQQLLRGDFCQDNLIRKVWEINRIRAIMLSRYLAYLGRFSAECRRVLRPGDDVFVTFGTSRISGIEVDMASIFKHLALSNGLEYVTTLIDTIPSRGLLTQRHRSASAIHDEQVVWLKG